MLMSLRWTQRSVSHRHFSLSKNQHVYRRFKAYCYRKEGRIAPFPAISPKPLDPTNSDKCNFFVLQSLKSYWGKLVSSVSSRTTTSNFQSWEETISVADSVLLCRFGVSSTNVFPNTFAGGAFILAAHRTQEKLK